MTSIVAEATVNGEADDFATIRVAGATVRPHHLIDGTLTVELDHGDEGGIKIYTLGAACALAAALQAVAVHQLEQGEPEAVAA
ncbi:MAG: hypothetical protein ACK5LO_08360 [Leucobacter sp.]